MFQSVRSRLTFWYTAILALVLVTFSGISYVLLARAIRSATDSSLAATAHEFTGAFSRDASNRGGDVFLDFRYSDREIIVFNERGQIVASSRPQMTRTEKQQLLASLRAGVTGSGGMQIVGKTWTAPFDRSHRDTIFPLAADSGCGIPVCHGVAKLTERC